MKKSIIIYSTIIVFLITACHIKSDTGRSYFAPDEKRCNILPVKIEDSIYANILFDTGSKFGYITLDSTFCAENSLFEDIGEQGKKESFFLNSWAGHMQEYRRSAVRYEYPLTMNIGGSNILFDKIRVQDTRRDFAVKVDGLLGFPKNDSTHIWEFNFGNDYLEVHQASDFTMPRDCYILPLVDGPWNDFPYVKFPMKIKNPEGDTVIINETYLVDTGLTQDIVLTSNAKNIQFFNNTENAVLIESRAGYRSRYTVSAEIFDGMKIDSLRIYTDTFAQVMIHAGYSGILGLNFLKRFNLFFDFKNKQLGFQPTGKYERAIDQNVRKFYYFASFTQDRKYIVTIVADIKNNPLKEAGLLVGDEIVALNGVDIKDLLFGRHKNPENEKRNTRILDIVRNGKKLQLTWEKSDDEWRGE